MQLLKTVIFIVKRDESKVKFPCINIDKTKLMLIYDKRIAIDVNELCDKDLESIKKNLSVDNNYNYFDREKIFKTKFYGNSLCIIPSNACQLRCKYCYSSSGDINSNKYIDINSIKECIDTIFENSKLYKNLPEFKLNFLFHGGGEPTENWPLFEKITEYILQKKIETGRNIFLKIVTNGIMDSAKAEWIAELFDEIVVSIDGPNYINDQIRVFKNQMGATNAAIASANIFGCISKLGIHSVVTALSVGKAKEIIDFFRKSVPNINYINFQRYRKTDNGRNEILELGVEEYMDFIQVALDYAPDLVRTSIADMSFKKAFCKGCSGNIIYCFPNGSITLCNEHDDGIYKVGSYENGIKIDPFQYSKYKDSIKNKMYELNCEHCIAFPFCGGGCHSYYLQCNNYSEEWCNSFKMTIKKMLKLKIEHSEKQYEYFNGNLLRYFYF